MRIIYTVGQLKEAPIALRILSGLTTFHDELFFE